MAYDPDLDPILAAIYARTSVPEAIAKLNPDVGTLVGIARAKIVEAAK